LVTMVAMGWSENTRSRAICGLGTIWQVALVGAYWPFTSPAGGGVLSGPIAWPMHTLVVAGLLLILAASFAMVFVLPAIALVMRISKARDIVKSREVDSINQITETFGKDESLSGLWEQYLAQVQHPTALDPKAGASSLASAREVFDPTTVANARLRLEFFRNLPGIFTGLGIIGTFGGLIMGLRTFHISQDPTVVQRSLEGLLGGVWQAFLVSAFAIALAIAVTMVEKLMLSKLSRSLDAFAMALDGIHPPRPRLESEGLSQRLVEALAAVMERSVPRVAEQGTAPLVQTVSSTDAATAKQQTVAAENQALATFYSGGQNPAQADRMMDMAASTRSATEALNQLVSHLPTVLTASLSAFTQGQQQHAQAMKTVSTRLEGVATGIEFSARKTLESVGARLMQSEMNMVSRHHAIADHIGELIQRLETLCGTLQRNAGSAGAGQGDPYGGFDSGSAGNGLGAGSAQQGYGAGFNAFDEFGAEGDQQGYPQPTRRQQPGAYANSGNPERFEDHFNLPPGGNY
jgi:hypothetical protein